ncbi:MAG: Concanavalin A-like lectin/glucanase superfamily protein [Daejeonella sp.]|nr:Concanavalin A-like lectin/glucanase superfamily protein [Daejeonella sp.]
MQEGAFYNVSGGGDPYAVGKNAVQLAEWNMITVTYTLKSNEIVFYVDGKLDHTVYNIPTPNPLTDVKLHIGKNSFNDPRGTTPSYFIKGKLDDMSIYKRKLNADQIKALYISPN